MINKIEKKPPTEIMNINMLRSNRKKNSFDPGAIFL